MAKLKSNTVVTHPETGSPVVLLAGEDVPDWALEPQGEKKDRPAIVGDHLIESSGDEPDRTEKPTGNASLEAWATYALESGQASEDEIKGLTRDQLRDKYGK